MYALYTEQRPLNGKNLLSWDLAHHLYARSIRAKVIVATDKPIELLSATRRQWFKLMRRVMRQRSSTMNTVRSAELTAQIAYMQGLRFSARQHLDGLEADVTFATAENLINIAPVCQAAYITCEVEKDKLNLLTAWMPEGGAVVIYTHPQPAASKNHRKAPINGANARTTDQKSHQAALR